MMNDQTDNPDPTGETTGDPTNGPLRDERARLEVAREKFSRVADDVRGRYQRVRGEVGQRARTAGEDLRRGTEVARERYEETSETLRQGYGRAQERARVASRDVSDFVQASPGRAVIMAAAVGFLIGLVARGRGRS